MLGLGSGINEMRRPMQKYTDDKHHADVKSS